MSDYIQHMPKVLLVDIVARVASSSWVDYFNVKLSCKLLKEAAEDEHVYKHVSLEELPVRALNTMGETISHFLNRCAANENADALYWLGMVERFSRNNQDAALEYLTKSASLGHVGACYAITIILWHNGRDFSRKGMVLFSAMHRSREYRDKVKFYRRNVIDLLVLNWENNSDFFDIRLRCDVFLAIGMCLKKHKEDDSLFCDACICQREKAYILRQFFQLFPF